MSPPDPIRQVRYNWWWSLTRPWAWIVDCHPRLRRLRRSPEGEDIVRGLDVVFPAMQHSHKNRVLRAVLRQRAYAMAVTLLMSMSPRFAEFFARSFPIRGLESVGASLRGNQSLVIVTFHTGPLYLWLATVKRAVRGRQIYAMHQDRGALFHQIVRLLHGMGIVSVPNRPMAMRTLIKVLREKARPVVTFACDYAGGSETVLFCGHRLSVAEGVRALHEATGAEVLVAVWEHDGFWPSVRFFKPSMERQGAPAVVPLTQAIFVELEPIVRAMPHRWASWETVVERLSS